MRTSRGRTDVGAGAWIWDSSLAPSPPVETAAAKQKDQHHDHDDQRGCAHDFPLPFESSLQASPPASHLRSALSTRERDCDLRTNYPVGTDWPPQALAKTTAGRGAAASHTPPARPTNVGRGLDIGTGALSRWRARRSKPPRLPDGAVPPEVCTADSLCRRDSGRRVRSSEGEEARMAAEYFLPESLRSSRVESALHAAAPVA